MCKSILLCVQIQEKTEKGEKDPIVTRLDAWEYARRNVNDIVDDPVAVQLLKDVVIVCLLS